MQMHTIISEETICFHLDGIWEEYVIVLHEHDLHNFERYWDECDEVFMEEATDCHMEWIRVGLFDWPSKVMGEQA